MKAVDTMGMF